jgi:hypothetical protein
MRDISRLTNRELDALVEQADAAALRKANTHLLSRRASDIAPKRIEYLWPGRIARGKHTAIAG